MGTSNGTVRAMKCHDQVTMDIHKSAAAKIQISNILHLLIHKYELVSVVVNIELIQEKHRLGSAKSIYTVELKEGVNCGYGILPYRKFHSKTDDFIAHISVPILRNDYNFGTLIAKPSTHNSKSSYITEHDLLPFTDKIAETISAYRLKLDEDHFNNLHQDIVPRSIQTKQPDDIVNSITQSQDIFYCLGFCVDINKEHSALAKAISYIIENYTKNFTMKELAEHCCVSASHLSCLIKNRFGLSFKKILMKIRIEKAKIILLKLPARQITNVCTDVGFSDLSHFERTFKKAVGVSPREFRNTCKNSLSTTMSTQGLFKNGIL